MSDNKPILIIHPCGISDIERVSMMEQIKSQGMIIVNDGVKWDIHKIQRTESIIEFTPIKYEYDIRSGKEKRREKRKNK